MLALLEERLPADLVVTDPADDRIVALDRAPIEFLAGNQWMFANAYWDSLAAFVQPNSPAIDQVLEATRQLPKDRSGNASTEGFVGSVRSRSDRVQDHLRNMFGEMTSTPLRSGYDRAGWPGVRIAADQAAINLADLEGPDATPAAHSQHIDSSEHAGELT